MYLKKCAPFIIAETSEGHFKNQLGELRKRVLRPTVNLRLPIYNNTVTLPKGNKHDSIQTIKGFKSVVEILTQDSRPLSQYIKFSSEIHVQWLKILFEKGQSGYFLTQNYKNIYVILKKKFPEI